MIFVAARDRSRDQRLSTLIGGKGLAGAAMDGARKWIAHDDQREQAARGRGPVIESALAGLI